MNGPISNDVKGEVNGRTAAAPVIEVVLVRPSYADGTPTLMLGELKLLDELDENEPEALMSSLSACVTSTASKRPLTILPR